MFLFCSYQAIGLLATRRWPAQMSGLKAAFTRSSTPFRKPLGTSILRMFSDDAARVVTFTVPLSVISVSA
jgi:hypothetical protein